MSEIVSIRARQILDSRGFPTLEVDVITDEGVLGRAAVPSGASTGMFEAVELRDGDSNYYAGKSVKNACEHVNDEISMHVLGMDVMNQQAIDKCMIELDGTDNKARLGANAILGVSMAVAKAAAKTHELPLYKYLGGVAAHTLPIPMMNILNGGKHADNQIDFQEFMIMPTGAASFSEALHIGAKVFYQLKKVLKEKGYTTNVGDEGGFAPAIGSNEEAIETVLEAIKLAGHKAGEDVFIALDAAATEMYDKEKKCYRFYKSSQKEISGDELVDYWANWVEKYPIISIEDPLDEEDWAAWNKLNEKLGRKVQIVGDDLFVTNTKRLKKGIEEKSANAILIKLNQIGTVSETIEAVRLAQLNGMNAVISHRSGETEDTFIADLAVALDTGQIKTGSLSRSDRVAKYNQLLRIEEELESDAYYPGADYQFVK